MQEFLLRILNQDGGKKVMSPETRSEFVRDCQRYITRLQDRGLLIGAQPLPREGKVLSRSREAWEVTPLPEDGELQVGYYHIYASDLDEALSIAKENPEFEFTAGARIEVRPIKTQEAGTGFVYPNSR